MARVVRWAGLGALAAAGCTGDGSRRDSRDDPLLGLGARPSGQPVAIATANPNGTVGNGPPPPAYQPRPPVTPALPTSNAALAAGFQPLAGGNNLRIGNDAAVPGGPTGATPIPQPAFGDPRTAQPAGGPVPLPSGGGAPIPVPPPGAGGTTIPVSGVSGGGALDQAYAAVAARNPLFSKLLYNSQTREWTFVLSVPSKLNASVQRTVEAMAATPTEAISRALEQLGNES
jgi:hypothetical protein